MNEFRLRRQKASMGKYELAVLVTLGVQLLIFVFPVWTVLLITIVSVSTCLILVTQRTTAFEVVVDAMGIRWGEPEKSVSIPWSRVRAISIDADGAAVSILTDDSNIYKRIPLSFLSADREALRSSVQIFAGSQVELKN